MVDLTHNTELETPFIKLAANNSLVAASEDAVDNYSTTVQ